MKVLVTGGAGFIGSHIVESLIEQGDEVVVLDLMMHGNKIPEHIMHKITLVEGDVCDRELVFKLTNGCERVFHLAALLGVEVVSNNEKKAMDIEMEGIINVCNAAIASGTKKVIYTSTSAVYGDICENENVSEDIPSNPKSSYAISKRHNEFYLATVLKEHGIESLSLRIFNVYGPMQDERMVIPRFLKNALEGNPIVVFGDGSQTRDFTYVKDVVHSMMLLADKVPGAEIFNIALGKDTTIIQLAEDIKKITQSNSPIILQDNPKERKSYEVQRRIGSADKLEKYTGYRPQTELTEGLKYCLESLRTGKALLSS